MNEIRNYRTRLGDIWQECREYLQNVGTPHNEKYGNRLPGFLDLWSMQHEVHWREPWGDRHHAMVVALVEPLDSLIVKVNQDSAAYYGMLKVERLDIWELTELCDTIKHCHVDNMFNTYRGKFDKVDEYVEYLRKHRHIFVEGERAVNMNWCLQGDGTYKHFPEEVTIVKQKDDHIIFKHTVNGIECMESAVLWQIRELIFN